MRPGATVICIDATNRCWFLYVGMRLVVKSVIRYDDGSVWVSFTSGPARMWPWEQFEEA